MVEFDVKRQIAVIGGTATTEKRLTLTSWSGRPAKLDIRTWREDKDGETIPGRGIALTDEEARALYSALRDYLGEGECNVDPD